jgi:ADP-L-glycero-D-manno-heptose 6-epimerase
MSKIIVTGSAGFIGSAVVEALNARGREDLLLVDRLDHDEKEHNVSHLKYEQLIDGNEFRSNLAQGLYDDQDIEAIFHLAAITSTTEKNWELFEDVNINFSQEIIRWCVDRKVRCVYVSSGATYGDGTNGYSDNHDLFNTLKPLNDYGKSKLDVDIWARDAGYLDDVVGIRYFNVFGPNEYHKGDMRSVIAKKFDQMQTEGTIELFKSNNPSYGDGEQKRDFVYVKDAVEATLFFLSNKEVGGVFNIGTGTARTWNAVAKSMFNAVGKEPNIKYVDMPDVLKGQYQDFTQADITKLRDAGFEMPFMRLEDAISEYVKDYLTKHVHIGE